MASSDIEKEMLNVLDDNETDINKIAFASHNFLLAREIIEKKEANGVIFNKEEKIKKFKELVHLIYEEQIKLLKEELLKQKFLFFFSKSII